MHRGARSRLATKEHKDRKKISDSRPHHLFPLCSLRSFAAIKASSASRKHQTDWPQKNAKIAKRISDSCPHHLFPLCSLRSFVAIKFSSASRGTKQIGRKRTQRSQRKSQIAGLTTSSLCVLCVLLRPLTPALRRMSAYRFTAVPLAWPARRSRSVGSVVPTPGDSCPTNFDRDPDTSLRIRRFRHG